MIERALDYIFRKPGGARRMTQTEPKSKALALVTEIDEAELGVRLMERGIGMRRAGDKRSAAEILDDAKASWPPGMVTSFPFGDMARIAIEYFRECIEKGQRPA